VLTLDLSPQSSSSSSYSRLSSRSSSSPTVGDPDLSLSAPGQPNAPPPHYIDTPIPGVGSSATHTSQTQAAAQASLHSYFASNPVGVTPPGSSSGSDTVVGDEDGRNDVESPAPDMYFDEDENLGPLEKIYLYARSPAVFHRCVVCCRTRVEAKLTTIPLPGMSIPGRQKFDFKFAVCLSPVRFPSSSRKFHPPTQSNTFCHCSTVWL
jgi:hypothetical protein